MIEKIDKKRNTRLKTQTFPIKTANAVDNFLRSKSTKIAI